MDLFLIWNRNALQQKFSFGYIGYKFRAFLLKLSEKTPEDWDHKNYLVNIQTFSCRSILVRHPLDIQQKYNAILQKCSILFLLHA